MTCDQSTNEELNKKAAAAFAHSSGESFFKTHEYLTSSDYVLRHINLSGDSVTFVYTANIYPSTCGWLLPGVDGSIVRVRTDLAKEPSIVQIF
jgi:hypothetical protein